MNSFLEMQQLLALFFSKNISVFAIFNAQRFNATLTYYIVSFKQLGPEPLAVPYGRNAKTKEKKKKKKKKKNNIM